MITRRLFNFIMVSVFGFGKKKVESLPIETEPEFEILQYSKPSPEVVYNMIKSGKQTFGEIRKNIIDNAKVIASIDKTNGNPDSTANNRNLREYDLNFLNSDGSVNESIIYEFYEDKINQEANPISWYGK